MKRSKKAAVLALALALAAASLAGCGKSADKKASNRLEKILAEKKITNVCEPYFAPYEFIDNSKSGQDQFRGADMEFARYIADELGVELEIVPLEWSAVLTGVTEGKYDMAVAGLGYSEERAQNMELSDIYKPGSEQGLLVRLEDLDKYNSLEDFAGKKVGFQSGTIQEQMATGQLPDSELVTFDIVQNAVLALASGKVDAVAVAVPNGEMFVASNPDLAVTPVHFEQGKSGNCIAVPKGETELRDRLNEIIAKVIDEGLYDQWLADATEEAQALGLMDK
jgi:polar amino acid transport system substrate-binding protein